MKMARSLCFVICAFCTQLSFSDEMDKQLQKIFDSISEERWNHSMELLLKQPEASPEANLLWASWYGAKGNPSYDLMKSTKSLEISLRLGSREAQGLLVARYLFSSNPEVTNYYEGMKLGRDLLSFYEGEIKSGNDNDGELRRIIGKYYIFGIGVEKNIEYGMDLIKKAAKLGDIEAKAIFKSK